jgi:sugar phosphate permease
VAVPGAAETATAAAAKPRFFYGWWIVFVCGTFTFFGAGAQYAFSLLVSPLTAEFGWSRAAISGAFSLRTEVSGLAAPVVGILIDRVGARRLMLAGFVLAAAGLIMLSQIDSIAGFYIAFVLIALGQGSTGGVIGSVMIAHWFRRKRGRATGFMTVGGAVAGTLVVVFAWLIDSFGWRDAVIAFAVFQFCLCVPLALTLRNKPEDMGLLPDGEAPEPPAADGTLAVRPAPDGMTMREAARSWLFWRIALAFVLLNFTTAVFIVHQVPFLEESVGMSSSAAATSILIMTAISGFGRVGLGTATDYLAKRYILVVCMVLLGLSLVLLATVHEPWQLVYVLPLYGIGFGGSVPTRATIQAEYFGLKSFGSIQGMMFAVATIGAVTGPILAGWMYDVTESYRLAFVLTGLAPIAGVPLILSTRPPRWTA